jgi:hypothetical protein
MVAGKAVSFCPVRFKTPTFSGLRKASSQEVKVCNFAFFWAKTEEIQHSTVTKQDIKKTFMLQK